MKSLHFASIGSTQNFKSLTEHLRKFSFSLIAVMLMPVSSFATFTGTVNTTESTCQANGTVTVTGADNTSLYALTGPNIPQYGPFSPTAGVVTFTDLPPGTYTVTEFKQNNEQPTKEAVVPGNYEQNWTWTAEVVYAPCSGGVPTVKIKNFNIINASPAQQRPPYVYRISTKNGSLPANGSTPPAYQNVSEFIIPYPAGVGGWYELQAKDDCGNFKTISIYVPDQAPAPGAYSTFNNFINCAGDAKYTVDAYGGTGPYTFEILAGSTDQVGNIVNNVTSHMYNLKADGYYKVKVTDQCGGSTILEIWVADYGQPSISIGGGLGNCGSTGPGDPGTGMFGITVYQYGIGPYSVQITSDCGYSQTFNNVSTYFEVQDLPRPCNYTIKVTDGCGFMNTYTQNLIGPGTGNLGCYTYSECPESNSELFRQVIAFNYGPPYNPTYPVTFDIKFGGVSIPGYPKANYFDYYVREALSPGIYTYSVVDACGSSCSGSFEVLTYKNPTLTVDVNSRCFSAGQATLMGKTFNPYNMSNTPGQYSIIDPSASRVGATGEPDSPTNSALFSNLVSEGFYTFQFWDGCKAVTTTTTIPKYSQPTWELGYGLICPPNTVADLQIINIQPQGQIVGPYYWQIINENSDIFNDPLPYPNAIGQTDSLFANLPPKNAAYDVATYSFLGYDGCKNSYQNQGKVGLFPDEFLILDKTSVCADENAKITARVSTPIVGATYKYYRDGNLVATSNLLFTMINPAYPGNYTAEIVVNAGGVECSKTTPEVVVTADGALYTQNPDPKCPEDVVDLTQYTQGSTPGNITFWKDENFTIPVPDPTMVIDPGTYYVHLITSGPPSCDLSGTIEVTLKPCKFDLALRKTLVSAGPFENGDDVTFQIEVFNQGQTPAFNIQVTDYIPSGMSLSPLETNWTVNSGKATLISPISSLAINASTTRNIILRIDSNFMGTTLRNWAEISSGDNDTNPENEGPTDFDSDPDNINFNQPGETNDLDDDNVIDEDRKNNGGDEDDHDPAEINVTQIFDLALKKVVTGSGPFQPNTSVTFQIEVINQGTLDATDIQITDYIPNGMTLDDTNWSVNTGKATLNTPIAFLGAGQSTTRNITLKINADFDQNSLRNWAEISSAINTLGQSDIDSDPDNINFNQPGETNDLNDDNVVNQNGKAGGDEDDHDPAEIQVVLFDLALKKIVDQAGPYSYGQSVPFRITVYNQGGVNAANVDVVDYIPSGFIYDPVNNPSWTFDGVNKATTTIPGVIPAGGSADIIIRFILKSNPGNATAYLNYAEITDATDSNGNPVIDIDSDPDNTNGNDSGGVPNTSTDNKIDGAPPVDEDDHDPALINVWDLALKKLFTSGSIQYGQNLTYTIWVYNQGTETAKDIVIRDYIPEGYSYSAASNPGWSGSYPNVNYTIAGPLVPGDSVAVTIVLKLENTAGGYRKWINYSEIISSKDLSNANRSNDDIDSNVGSDGPAERAVLPNRLNDNNIFSTNKGGEEDDHDPAGAGPAFGDIFDLALRKTVTTAGPYAYGQDVDFRIRVFNQGSVTAQNIELVDYVPVGFDFVPGGVNSAWAYSSGVRQAKMTYPGPLKPGDSADVTIRLRILSNPGNSQAYINFAEIENARDTLNVLMSDIDSSPDDDPLNDTGGVPGGPTDDEINDDGTIDEDDHDPAFIHLYDLALKKVIVTPGPYVYGQPVDFRISVFNQGTQFVKNIEISDYIPEGFDYLPSDNLGIWTGAYPLVKNINASSLSPGGSYDVILRLRLKNTNGGYRKWINYAEITRMEDQNGNNISGLDVDSNPASDGPSERAVKPGDVADDNITSINKGGEEDDHDPAGLQLFDLALKKSVATAGPYSYGQDIDFRIRIYNQGNTSAQNILITDYVPNGFQFVSGGVNSVWNYSAGTRKASTTLASLLKPGDSADVVIRLKILPNMGQVSAYYNFAEITSSQDSTGQITVDIDSSPDNDPNNDTGGVPGGPTDDEINQRPPTDEDDHDPAFIQLFDLALRKKLINQAPYTYGQTHNFQITVFNQGTIPATNIVLNEYIPQGYTFSANNGWTGGPSLATRTLAGPLAPGDSISVSLNLTFQMVAVPTSKSWINYSEIASARDNNGNLADDVDSDPGSNGPNENNVLPGKSGDDDIASTTDNGVGSQDDHDPAGPWIFDLATIIENSTDVVSNYGEVIGFPITVKNQGNIPSAGYTMSVLVPTGFQFNGGLNPGWSYNNVSRIASYTVPVVDTIHPGDMDMYLLNLTAQPSSGADAWTVEIEISADNPVADEPGINDIDSNPDAVFNNDAGGAPIPDSEGGSFPGSDDILMGNGSGAIGGTNAQTDEDDNDPEYVRVFDLALRKRLMTAGPYVYGQTHSFQITIFNQGNVAATNVVVNDYIPEGYGFTANNGWSGGPSVATRTIAGPIQPGDSVNLLLNLTFNSVSNPGYRSWINYSEIASANDNNGNPANDVDSDPGSNGPNENNVLPGKPGDDDVASITDNGIGSQDDHDPAGIEVFDLALRKNVVTVGPYSYGQDVEFRIRVYNQGNVTAQNISIVDYVPVGLDFISGGFNSPWTYTSGNRQATRTISGPIKPGDSAEVLVRLRVLPNQGRSDAYLNYAEIRSARDTTNTIRQDTDSDSDDDPVNDNGGEPLGPNDDRIDDDGDIDEDDHDPAVIHVYDLALQKVVVTPAPYAYDQVIDFRITVYNQGTLPVSNIEISDYIPAGYSYNPLDNAGVWSGSYPLVKHTLNSTLLPGGSYDVVLKLRLENTAGGYRDWINYAEITRMEDQLGNNITNSDVDSRPASDGPAERAVKPGDSADNNITSIAKGGEEDDHDPAGVQIYDLAQRKVVTTPSPYSYNQDIDFRITVFNQGNMLARNISVVDYVPAGFQFVTGGVNTGWLYNGINRQATRTIAGPLSPGDSVSVSVRLKLLPNAGDEDAYTNISEIRSSQDSLGLPGNDIDSDPDDDPTNDDGGDPDGPTDNEINNKPPVDEDDHDPARISVYDLALRKLLISTAPFNYGQDIQFKIWVFNQGNETVRNITIQDYIPAGYQFNAGSNPGWTPNGNGAVYTYGPALAPGDSVSVDLTLKLGMTNGSYFDWINFSEITGMEDLGGNAVGNKDIDSNPGSNGVVERSVKPGDAADNNITSINKGGEEDDHDPAGIYFMDLALRKVVVTPAPYSYNQTVDFRITVYNQGNTLAQDVLVTDYIPSGFGFATSNPASWTYNSGTRKATRTISGPIRPGDSAQVILKLVVLPNPGDFNGYRNTAEISQMRDSTGTVRPDIDSTPDDNRDNDSGGVPDGPTDDEINQTPPFDEDDQDPAIIHVFDLALRKLVVTPAPYSYGQTLDFRITVINQGTLPVSNILVKDHIPVGYIYVPADNAGVWSGAYPQVEHLHAPRLNPGDSFSVIIKLRINNTAGGYRHWFNYSEVASFADSTGTDVSNKDVDSNPDSDNPVEQNVKPGDAADNFIGSIDKGGEEDDHDPAGIYFMDLALRKKVVTSGPYTYNQEVEFGIMVYNQGNTTAQDFLVTDYLPAGFAFSASNPVTWNYNGISRQASTLMAGPLVPGDSAYVSIKLIVLPNPGNFNGYRNISEISQVRDTTGTVREDIDSTPDTNKDNDSGGVPDGPTDDEINQRPPVDEDDHDPAIIHVFDLALRKVVVTPEPYAYDQTVEFKITVWNQGTLPVTNIRLNDHIPIGYSYVAADNAGVWTGAHPLVNHLRTNRLNPGDSFSVSLKLRIENTAGGFRDWINYSEIAGFADSTGIDASSKDTDSNPGSDGPAERAVRPGDAADNNISSINKGGEEDDHDPAGITVFDLALRKIYTGSLPIRYDQVIPFEVTVFNQGNVSALNPQIVDYLPVGYNFVPGSNPGWTYNAATRKAQTSYIGKVQPGDSIKLSINLQVVPTLYNRNAWKNFAEIFTVVDTTGTPRTDIDSNPDDNPNNDGPEKDDEINEKPPVDEDDQDPANPPVLDLALRKWIPGKKPYYVPGDTVSFVISLHNQGNVVAASTGVNDYMPQGFQFLPAINPGWSVVGGRLEYTYNNRLNPEDSVQLQLKLKVIVAANPTLQDWENYAEIRSVVDTFGVNRSNDDADSQPNTDDAWERAVKDDTVWDDVIDGNGQIVGEDSDDHDPEKVVVTAWIGDYVWKDLNGNGIQDSGEPGIPGVHVYLYKCDGSLVRKDTTDFSGKYEFDFLISDSYFLRFDIVPIGMPNCGFTFKDRGINDALDSDVNAAGFTECTFLQWGERDSTWDAGLVELAKYGDYVWHDRDADGRQETGEEGIKDVKVTLYNADTGTPVRTTTTNSNGFYLFEFLMPGNYYAKYDWDPMWQQTSSNTDADFRDSDVDGSNGVRTNATTYLSPGEDDRTWDLGLYKCVMIGGRVFLDSDKDGVFDLTENGINGVDVYLVDALTGIVVSTLRTSTNPGSVSDDGYYKFACVKPGIYYVRFQRPGHLAASDPYMGGNSDKDSDISHENGLNSTRVFTVLSGDMILNVGAGFQIKATVGTKVWLDKNNNGLQDQNEAPVHGVVVSAYNTKGTMVSLDTTRADGTYNLDGIAQGDYYVKFSPPAQYGFTIPKAGPDNMDSDVTGTQGFGTTKVYRVLAGDRLPYIDAGLVAGVLPLEWLSFEGRYNGQFTDLEWATGVELNNSHFVVERRHETETSFEEIGQVAADPNSTAARHDYGFQDVNVVKSGIYYYRIRQVDLDGSYDFSKTISIRVETGRGLGVEIYPNPVNDLLKVDIWLNEDSYLEVRVFDENGKNVLTQPFGGYRRAGQYSDQLETDLLIQGQYNLQIKTTSGLVNKKFTVAR